MKLMKRKGLTSVQLRPEIEKKLIHYIQAGKSKSEVINAALHEYLIDRELDGIRQGLLPYAQAKGVYTDEDVERLMKRENRS